MVTQSLAYLIRNPYETSEFFTESQNSLQQLGKHGISAKILDLDLPEKRDRARGNGVESERD
jgi:hypothetical protein